MDTCVCVCIEMTESLPISEDKSLGSTRINSEFKGKINAAGQQSFFQNCQYISKRAKSCAQRGRKLEYGPSAR